MSSCKPRDGAQLIGHFASRQRTDSSDKRVLEMRDAGGLDCANLRELYPPRAHVGEEASTIAEQQWNDMELELVQQSRGKVLRGNLRATPEHDVLTAGGIPRLLERGLDAVGDEVVRGLPFHLHRIAGVWLHS
jgi:hypothetical protein